MNLKSGIPALIIFLCTLGLAGQDRAFTASAPAAVRAGEQFQYVIEGSEQGEVMLPQMEGLQLLAGPFSSYSSHSQWINGKMTMKTVVSYTHVFRAVKEGTFTIPPATVKVGRKEHKTNEVKITVSPGDRPVPDPAPTQPGREDASAGTVSASEQPHIPTRIVQWGVAT